MLQLLINGLAMGFIYALVGVEFTLIVNSTGLTNFSHDKFIALGAYCFAGLYVQQLGLSPALAVIATLATMFFFGVIVALGIFIPLSKMSSDIFALIGTVVLGRIISEIIRLIWGPLPFTVNNFLTGTLKIGNIVIGWAYVYIIIISIIIVAGLQILFKFTKVGKAIRCVSQNKAAASLMGVNVAQNIAFTTALSTVICMVIGILVIPLFTVEMNMAGMVGLKGFAAGVIGGFGYLPGAILGGLTLGLVESISVTVLPAVYKDCVAFIILIVFLLFKPTGMLGHKK
ncbi:branched-chain amino acid ABC transporter permease [Clostridium sp. KNHs216]|uniref:branched-chain amino acid ABC transporter permease n=1 Tax=Clostridium sp. KNHs216 TaxID=1550235 RepID=UPI001152A366|nr:branched-chain amino acid ABC transporter permease [Clostridium sp. KNHs216]TQI68319.1 branched-chain amino acid transport system permease protein [Clostridium sp. KNHs216]